MSIGVTVFVIMFAIVFICRIPVPYGFLAIGVVYFVATGGNVGIVANNVLNTYWTNYIIIAVPLFIFSANVMNAGRITEMLFRFADGLVGRFRGGMALVNVLGSLIFSGMTGSAIADASGLGIMEIREMHKQGYDDGFSAAMTACSATIGPVFPPSMPMLIYASISGTSVGALFMGGMIPGVMMAIFLAGYVLYISQKRKYPYGSQYTLRTFIVYSIQAFPALLTPVILLGGIYGGAVTPTEAASVAGFYALLVSVIVYKVLSWKDLKKILFDTTSATGTVALTVACASVIMFISAREQIPQFFGSFILNLTENKNVFLLAVNILFLILGMFFDSTTITMVFVPMLLPLVTYFKIDPVHFGVIFVVNMMIGLLTPPYGSLLFVTSAVSGVKMGVLIKECFPMILVLIALLMILTYIPATVTFLPNLFLK
jgi:tripartite ATP-independent transporter DctM subunit